MSKHNSLTTFELFVELLKDPERKSLVRMLVEIIQLTLLYKTIPHYYFSRYLFKGNSANIVNYLPNRFLYNLKSRYNEKGARALLENKLYYDFFYRQFDLHLPRIVMYNHRQCFVIDNQNHAIKMLEDFKLILRDVIENKLSGNPIFIKKMYGSYHGDKIFKLTIKDLQANHELVNQIYLEVITTGYLFQETVKQHAELDRLNPSCLNTLRIDTFFDQSGEVEVISSYFKTNLKNHYIDNERSGGCEIPVDLQTGKLKKYGFVTLKMNGLVRPMEHPFTKVHFENFQIPYFEEAKQLALRAASYMPSLRLVGWDVAICPSGPVLIEGNSDYNIAASDLSYGGYKSNPVFQKVLKEIGEHESR